MRKIPTLFVRDPEDMKRVTREVHPDCQWVLDGHGTPTRKYDGTCVRLDDGGNWWARREVKPGKTRPADFVPIETDPATGKTVGWEPMEQSPFKKFHAEALAYGEFVIDGTYELCGPKINGNPEGFGSHVLIRHAHAEQFADEPRTYDRLRDWLLAHQYEGIVWHGSDGRMAKLKRSDFR